MTPNITRRLDSLVLILTVLAALPYELGSLATVIPPAWKPGVAAIGIAAKLVLAEIKTRQTANKEEL
jgi:hypothetical protein